MDSFVEKTPFVKKWQTAEMIQVQVNGYNIFIQNKNKANIIA
ncbi:ABC transporter permease protein [Bacillus thuringiensis serovar indiana]|nr:ABC transporter permease protein [Bacillus thuringiensis serovar indiana]